MKPIYIKYRSKIQRDRHKKRGIFVCVSFFSLILLIAPACNVEKPYSTSDVLLLVNTNSQAEIAIQKVIPYFNHFGVKYQMIDIAKENLPNPLNFQRALCEVVKSGVSPEEAVRKYSLSD